ncbi:MULTISPECIES: hypothetical protein [Pseudomonas]|uniref:hypothetical protein n=1 Tax=Pseudomonas TaxID=286 RepID=UPI001CBC0CBD|nr:MULTISPECIES: hypothetical protein [Pseudomonas]MCP1519821.1 hypothetical protein [Pseudomonas migulae]
MTQHSISRAFYSCVKQYRNSLEVYGDSCHNSRRYSAVSAKSVLLFTENAEQLAGEKKPGADGQPGFVGAGLLAMASLRFI